MNNLSNGPKLSIPNDNQDTSVDFYSGSLLKTSSNQRWFRRSHFILLLITVLISFSSLAYYFISSKCEINPKTLFLTPVTSQKVTQQMDDSEKKNKIAEATANFFSFDGDNLIHLASLPQYIKVDLFNRVLPDMLIYIYQNVIYQLQLGTGEKRAVLAPSLPENEVIVGGGSVSSSEFYYVVGPNLNTGQERLSLTMYLVNTATGNTKVFKSLPYNKHGSSYIYLFHSNDSDYFVRFDYTECRGGQLYRYHNSQLIEIAKIGYECSLDPRYIGFIPNTIEAVFASAEKEFNPKNPTYADADLYLLNLENGSITQLLDLAIISSSIKDIILDQELQQIAIITQDTIHLFDIPTRKLIKKIPIPFDKTSFYSLTRGKLFGSRLSSGEYIVIDLYSERVNRLAFSATPIKNEMSYFGVWEGRAILFRSR